MNKSKDKSKVSKYQIDWEAIYREYRAGILSVREIASMFGISHTAIQKRVKKYPDQWKRDLTKRIQEEVARKLVTDEVATADEVEIIDTKADQLFAVIRKHRTSIAKTVKIMAELFQDLQDQRKGAALNLRASGFHHLVSAMEKLQRMERQAFGISSDFKLEQEEESDIKIILVQGVVPPNREDEYEPKKLPYEARLLLPGETL